MDEVNAIDERGTFFTRLPRIDQEPVRVIEVPRRRFQFTKTDEAWKTWIYRGIIETQTLSFGRKKVICGVPTWKVEAFA